ncbi:MAG: endonuclease [Clostridiales bacterium]|nr:endonuclease [Clostridiales bacterium]
MKQIFTRITLWVMALATAMTAQAEVPVGYYKDINGKKDADLKTALAGIISKRAVLSNYNDYYKNMPQYFKVTDVYPGTNRWWDMYSDIPLYAPSFSGLNREHCLPKSWWGGTTNIPIYADLNNLFPSEAAANQKKSNYPLGVVSTATFDNGVSKLGYPSSGQGGGAAYVFEPADEYKGDFARTYFYMVTCYEGTRWTHFYMLQNSNYLELSDWARRLLLQWHHDDPVSEKELDRNDEVYKIQNNRNPYIDYPSLVDYIWGDKAGEFFYESNSGNEPAGDPILITPVQDMSVDFNEVAVNNTTTARLHFKGENLTGSLSLAITKPRGYENDDRAYFSIDSKSINTSAVNKGDGFWLTITYKPTVEGNHYARLVVSDGGMTGSLGIALRGQACPVPTLKAFQALPAEEVTSGSYLAVWDEPDDVVDYYVVTRTRYYQNATDASEELLAETNSLLIEDYDPSVKESYHVQSVRLGYRSPVSNEIYVESTGGIDTVGDDLPLGTAYIPGGVRFVCGTPHTGVVIYDMQGRSVATVDYIENNSTVLLPVGVYVVTTDQCQRPVKIVVI